MIDDNLVETDKIGIGTFFWALPSKGFQVRKNLIEDYDKKIENAKKEIEETEAAIIRETEARVSNDGEREKMIEELEKARKTRADLEV